MYQDSRSYNTMLLYQRPGMPTARYWNCTVCGPLYQRNNRLGSIKPSACTGRCPGPQGWQDLDPHSNTLVLKRGSIYGLTYLELPKFSSIVGSLKIYNRHSHCYSKLFYGRELIVTIFFSGFEKAPGR